MSEVKIINLTKSIEGKYILSNVSIELEEGEFLSLLGPSGCGKTTLLNAIAGIVAIDSGEIFFGNIDVTNTPTNKRKATIVFQDYALFPHMTVYDNIAFGLKMKKLSKEIIKKEVMELLEVIELSDKINNYPKELSGGQKQRVAIARAIAIKPMVLLLDEPFSGLDNSLKNTMHKFIMNITKKYSITTIMVTHDKNEAFKMSNKIAIMLNGEIKQIDYSKDIYKNISDIKVVEFLEEFNIIKGKIINNNLVTQIGSFEIKEKQNKYLVFKYDQVHIKYSKDKNEMVAEIIEKYYMGNYTTYILMYNMERIQINIADDKFDVGDKVNIEIKDYKII